MKHVVCYSGGHSSGVVAVEVVRRYGAQNTILLNHNINSNVESEDIKRFKNSVSEYLHVPITYANHDRWDTMDQFDIIREIGSLSNPNSGAVLCTDRLKTRPFKRYLQEFFPEKDCVIYYGFDASESSRIQRRSSILSLEGYRSDYPLALWKERTLFSTEEIGIARPNGYSLFKHANCTGCLKAGKQHWYLVYLHRKDIWAKALELEDHLDFSILKSGYLSDLEPMFKRMEELNIQTTEHEQFQKFFRRAEMIMGESSAFKVSSFFDSEDAKPCECMF